MKIRKGFVSNSSSSSFVVAIDGPSDVVQAMVQIDFGRFADVTITDLDKLDEYVFETYQWRQESLAELLEKDEHIMEMYTGAKKAIEGGQRVIWGTLSNDGYEHLENYLYYDGIPESSGITIISEGG